MKTIPELIAISALPSRPERPLFDKWIRYGDSVLSDQDRQRRIKNTMSTTTGSQGGFTVQSDVAQTLVDSLKIYSGMRQVATILQTTEGNPLAFPISDGTAEFGELITENTPATLLDTVFGTIPLPTYKFSSKIFTVPIELAQDAAIDFEAFIAQRAIDRIGRTCNQLFTVGTGTGQPTGVVTAATAGKVGTTGQTLTVIFDDLVDLIHSVDAAYRQSSQCVFMMNDATFKALRKLKDTATRPIFLPGFDGLGSAGAWSIEGFPVVINNDVPVMAANAKSILFGDFSRYVIRDVIGADLLRFTDSAYSTKGQIGFLMWMRSGGNFTDTAAIKYYQNSAT